MVCGFPSSWKANIGGSGAARAGSIDLGVDHVALVQELAPLKDGHWIRGLESVGADLLLLQFSPQLEEMERFSEGNNASFGNCRCWAVTRFGGVHKTEAGSRKPTTLNSSELPYRR